MKRDSTEFDGKTFDVIVVGGGIFGAYIAWEAALRGLTVALIEKEDFGHATSASHFKVVHGGIRYLQHGDVARIRESSLERSAFLRIAPHLVYPLPFVIPTYGHGLKGREAMTIALKLYDALTFDRNRGIADPSRRVPAGRVLSRREALRLIPDLNPDGLTGAAIFHDGQMYNPPRLTLAFVQAAAARGALAANYVQMEGLIRERPAGRVVGVQALDRLSGRFLEIRGRVVVNATGPWARWLLGAEGRGTADLALRREPAFSRDAYFVVNRRLPLEQALSIQGQTRDPDALLSRGNRHLFLVPWRNHTLVGVWHTVFAGRPEDFTVTPAEIERWIDEVNRGWPGLDLKLEEVTLWNAGLTLFGENEAGATHLSYGKRSIVVDHQVEDGVDGLITVVGVRYTTGRGVAAEVGRLIARKLEKPAAAPPTESTPIHGGEFSHFAGLQDEIQHRVPALPPPIVRALAHNYGSVYGSVLALGEADPALLQPLPGSTTLKAEIVHAVRHEMALTLADVALRRTDLGTAGYPGAAALDSCAALIAQELGWSPERTAAEIAGVTAGYPAWQRPEVDRVSDPFPSNFTGID